MVMRRKLLVIIVVLISITAGLLRPALADCQVNGVVGSNGTAGDDTIICDNNPAPAGNVAVAGGVGNDTIIIDSNAQLGIAGDGTVAGMGIISAPVAGADTIIVNGTTNAAVYGDFLNTNVNGAADTITINGTVSSVEGDTTTGTAVNGGDTITINGTVTGNVMGDTQAFPSAADTNVAGNDTITVNGTVGGNVIGDNMGAIGTRIGGSDTIIINSTAQVTGNVNGEVNATVGGNDSVTISVGATVTGTISGGNVAGDFDTIIFSGTISDAAGYNQIQTFVSCNPCSGSVTIDGHTYNFTNFEQLQNLLTLYIPPGPVTPVPVEITISQPPDDRINWGYGDWLAPIYNHNGTERGISIFAGDDGLWIPETALPTTIPAETTLVACNTSSTICLYQLGGSGYWQVSVNLVIDGIAQQVTVTFDSLNPTILSSN
jgi:hypothetical protein